VGKKELPDKVFRHAVARAPFGIAVVGGGNEWLYVNRALAESFGYALPEWPENRTWWDLTHDADRDGDQACVNACLLPNGPNGYTLEKRYNRKNPGEFFWAEVTVSVIRDNDGNFENFISFVVPTDRPAISATLATILISNWKPVSATSIGGFFLIAWAFGLISTEKLKQILEILLTWRPIG